MRKPDARLFLALAFGLLLLLQMPLTAVVALKGPTPTATSTATAQPATATPGLTSTPEPTATPEPGAPYPAAPLCASHSYTEFHTLWNAGDGCHYDHEHGQNPFVPEVAAVFSGIQDFLGGVQVGHTNPSSPIENTDKHGGMKYNVQLTHIQPCVGFESATHGSDASVVQYHGFGDPAIELEARIHSTVAFVRQCDASNPTDFGYVYVVQHQDYGQRIVPYQGTIVGYPNQPVPAYDSPRGPYLSIGCIDAVEPHVAQCRSSLAQAQANSAVSNWASKPTGVNIQNPFGSRLFQLLWSVGDTYRLFDWNDQEHPFTFLWLCSADGGIDYDPVGCEYNNSTTTVREIQGLVPAAWDSLAGFDTDSRVGRITGDGFVDQFGTTLSATCLTPGGECFPIKFVNAFVGTWGSVLRSNKLVNVVPSREGDIYFCGQTVCAADAPGAVPSGWIGSEN